MPVSAFEVAKPTARFGAARAGSVTSRTRRGFTLIELVIVMAIIAILVAIALPSYQDSVRKSRRGAAKSLLVELAQRYERFHTINNTYAGFFATIPAGDLQSPTTGGPAFYNILEPVAGTATVYTLSAVPQGSQTDDVRCMTLTLNQAGVRTESGTGVLADCW